MNIVALQAMAPVLLLLNPIDQELAHSLMVLTSQCGCCAAAIVSLAHVAWSLLAACEIEAVFDKTCCFVAIMPVDIFNET
jgi:hypothetical protein